MVSHFARFPTVSRRCREVNINYAKHFLCWVWSSSFAGRPESRYYPKLTFFQNSCWLSCRGHKKERTKTWSKFIITTHANIYRYRCRKAYRNSFIGTLGNPIDLVGSIRQGFEFDVRVACLSICVNCRRNMSCALPSYRGPFLRLELMLFVVVIKRTYRQTNYP